MSRYSILSTLALAGWMLITCEIVESPDPEIVAAVNREVQNYPRLELRDIYKSFFLGAFGPGHMISDTAAVRLYMHQELQGVEAADGNFWEPAGFTGQFVRVNLSVVAAGIVPAEALLQAFVESAIRISSPDIDGWKAEWARIVAAIRVSNFPMNERFEDDLADINKALQNGNPVLHHSQQYLDAYDPHYRIIRKDRLDRLRADFHF